VTGVAVVAGSVVGATVVGAVVGAAVVAATSVRAGTAEVGSVDVDPPAVAPAQAVSTSTNPPPTMHVVIAFIRPPPAGCFRTREFEDKRYSVRPQIRV
jgi:hypothetical protein